MLAPRAIMIAFVVSLLSLACGGPPGPAEYPEMVVHTKSFAVEVKEPRKKMTTLITEPQPMSIGEEDTYPQPLPEGFLEKARARLSRLAGQTGPKVVVTTEIRRCDVTFYNDKYRGEFTRYDVVLGFVVRTENGALLDKGSAGLWHELPKEEATPQEMQRVFLDTALGAFDKYFADEDNLEKIDGELQRYLESHPEER